MMLFGEILSLCSLYPTCFTSFLAAWQQVLLYCRLAFERRSSFRSGGRVDDEGEANGRAYKDCNFPLTSFCRGTKRSSSTKILYRLKFGLVGGDSSGCLAAATQFGVKCYSIFENNTTMSSPNSPLTAKHLQCVAKHSFQVMFVCFCDNFRLFLA